MHQVWRLLTANYVGQRWKRLPRTTLCFPRCFLVVHCQQFCIRYFFSDRFFLLIRINKFWRCSPFSAIFITISIICNIFTVQIITITLLVVNNIIINIGIFQYWIRLPLQHRFFINFCQKINLFTNDDDFYVQINEISIEVNWSLLFKRTNSTNRLFWICIQRMQQ